MGKIIGLVLGIIVVVVAFVAIATVPFLLAWNYVSSLFGLPYLDWTQAFAILVVVYAIGNGFKASTASK